MAEKNSKSNYQVFLNYCRTDNDLRLGFADYLRHCMVKIGLRVFSEDDHEEEEEEEEMEEEEDEEDNQERKQIEVDLADHPLDEKIQQAINDCRVYILIFSKDYASSKSCLQELEAIIVQSNKSAVDKMIAPIFFDVTADDVLRLDIPTEEKKALEEVLNREGQPWELKDNGYAEFCEMVAMEVPIKFNAKTLNRMSQLLAASGHTILKEVKGFQTDPLLPSNICPNPGATSEKEKLSIQAEMQDYSYDVFLSFRRSDTRQAFVEVLRESMKKADICFFEDDPVLITEEDLERLSKAIDNSEFCVPILSKTYGSSFWCLIELEKMVQSGKTIIPVFYGVERNDVVQMCHAALEVCEENIRSEIVQQWEKAIISVSAMEGWKVKDQGTFQFSRYFAEHIFAQLPGTPKDQAKDAGIEKKEEKYSAASGSDYEVFLSFQGVDAGAQSVAKQLNDHLTGAGIHVFKNEEKLLIGDRMDTLLRVIKTSKICIPIFSKSYTSSRWCLREIARMVEYEKEIVPIFYDVEPGDITKVNVQYQKVFPIEETQQWKDALSKVAKIKGWELKHKRNLDDLPLIAEDVLLGLKAGQRLAANHLVGIHGDDGPLSDILKMIDIEVPDVRMVAICGEDGVGKTTLAKAVFNQLSGYFDCCSFIENVSTYRDQLWSRPNQLRAQLLLDLLGPETAAGIPLMASKELLRGKKVLIVLDDVEEYASHYVAVWKQLELALGSRVIFTTSPTYDDLSWLDDGQPEVYEMRRIFPYQALELFKVYEMRRISPDQALELFKLYAFESTPPKTTDSHLNDLASKIVASLGYLPLAVEIAGSFLSRQPLSTWERTLEKLSKNVYDGYLKSILKICYAELEDNAKQIFLDIACFFADREKINAFHMWEACGLSPDKGIKALLSMSLIKITEDNRLWMHGLVRQFGREIVRRENPENPELRSRVWYPSAARELLSSEKVGKKVKALRLTWGEVDGEVFKGLQDLRFLQLDAVRCKGEPGISLSNLKWLSWHTSEFQDFGAESLNIKNLVVLDLSRNYYHYSASSSGSQGQRQRLPDLEKPDRLKVLDLSGWRELTRIPGLYRFQSLERLVLEGCERLVIIDNSLGSLRSLKYLNIRRCYSLKGLPEELSSLTNLAEILVEGNCNSFSIPEAIGMLKSLTILEIAKVRIGNLPESIGKLQKLKKLRLFGCKGIRVLPESFGHLKSLVELDISYSDVTELPWSIGDLKELKKIKMEHCSVMYLPVTLGSVEKLEELYAKGCTQLTGEVPKTVGKLCSLRILDLSDTAIRGLPNTINQISSLGTLSLGMCNHLQELPDLPVSLTRLTFTSSQMRRIPDISKLHKLVDLVLSNFTGLKSPDATDYTEHSNLQSASGNWLGLFPGLVHTVRHTMGAGHARSRYLNRKPVVLSDFIGLKFLKSHDAAHYTEQSKQQSASGNWHPKPIDAKSLDATEYAEQSKQQSASGNWLSLNLNIRYITKLPDELEALSRLKTLTLSCPDLNQCPQFPPCLSKLVLRFLKAGTKLFPLSNLRRLLHLEFDDCRITDDLIGSLEIAKIASLEHLYINRCSFRSLGGLHLPKNLIRLEMNHNNYLKELPQLRRLQKLGHLVLLDCPSLSEVKLPNSYALVNLRIEGCKKHMNAIGLINQERLLELSIQHCNSSRELELGRLRQLRVLKIDSCLDLVKIDVLEELRDLEELFISGCHSLESLKFTGGHIKLMVVKVESCMKLMNINFDNFQFLEELSISGCDSVQKLEFGMLLSLKVASISSCKGLKNLDGMEWLNSLEELSISGCDSLERLELPESLKLLRVDEIESRKELEITTLVDLHSLQELSISGRVSLETSTFLQLKQLRVIKIDSYKGLTEELDSLEELSISGCHSLERLQISNLLQWLRIVKVEKCKELVVIELGELRSLQELSISGCDSLGILTFKQLKQLKVVKIDSCRVLKNTDGLGGLDSLEELTISGCDSLTGLAIQNLKSCKVLHIGDCKKLNGIAGLIELESLQELSIIGCKSLQDLGDLSRLRYLNVVHVRGCEKLKSVKGLHRLPFLKNLQISDCKSFESNLDGLKPTKRSLAQTKRGLDFARKQKTGN